MAVRYVCVVRALFFLKKKRDFSDERDWSKCVTKLRVVQEQSFHELKANWAFSGACARAASCKASVSTMFWHTAGHRWQHNVLEQRVYVSVLLANCLLCIRGQSQAAAYFNVGLPTLEEYLLKRHDASTATFIEENLNH